MDKGILAATLSTIFIGFSIVVTTVATRLVNPVVFAALAYGFSLVFIGLLVKLMKTEGSIKDIFTKYKRDFSEIVVARIVLGQIILLFGFSMTIAIRAVFVLRLEPLFVLIYSAILLGEKVTKRKIILMAALVFGAFVFATNLSGSLFQDVMIGDILIIIALAFLAYSYIPSMRISKRVDAMKLTLASNLLGFIVLMPVAFVFLPASLNPGIVGLGFVALYTILFYVCGVILWFHALKTTKPWIVASVLALEPIAGSLLAFFWLGQTLTLTQLLGGLIMIATTYFIARENMKI